MHVYGLAKLERGDREPAWATVLDLAKALGVSCEAFTQEPAEREPAGPGRPRNAEEEPAEGKPGKAAGKPATGRTAGQAGQGSGSKKKARKGKE